MFIKTNTYCQFTKKQLKQCLHLLKFFFTVVVFTYFRVFIL